MTDTTDRTAVQRLREAAAKIREEATELAKLPAPSLTAEYPDVDACAAHLSAMREMKLRYALAAWLELEADVIASRAAQPEGGEWAVDTGGDHALAVADAILGPAS